MQLATCPSREQLSAFVLGKLPDLALKQVAEHSSGCANCQKLLHSLDAVSDPLILQIRQQRLQKIAPELACLLKRVEALGAEANTVPPGNTVAGNEVKLTQEVQQVLAPAQAAGELGRLGKYRVLKLLGQGGMGMVFQAEDPHLQRAVALKVMLPSLAANAAAKERFLREARATAAIEHDHIVTIHQVDEDRGVPFLAMQMLKGMSLEDYLKKKRKSEPEALATAGLTTGQILKLGREIAKGLAAAHERGLIHRDIKPANVWLDATAGGRVKILDFGLARPAEADSSITQSGMIVGTPAYMAPEQAQGKPVDGRADLFSLGVVLYRLCAGRLPWKGENAMATLMAVATEEAVPVQELNPTLPPKLADLVMRLLAKNAADRPKSAKAVVEAIQAIEREQASTQTGKSAAIAVPAQPADASAWQGLVAESATAPLVRKPASQRYSSRRVLWIVASLAVAAALTLAATVIYVQTDNGTLKIETFDPEIRVVVEQGGKVVKTIDPKTGSKVVLESGEYRLRLGEEEKNVVVTPKQITLKRGQTVVATITMTKDAAVQAKPPAQRPLTGQGSDSQLVGEIRRFEGHKGEIYSVAFSPDGRRALTTSADSTIRMWDVPSGQQVRIWDNLRQPVQAIFCDNGRKVWCGAGGSADKSGVLMLDAETGKELQRNVVGDTWCQGLALSRDEAVGLSTGFGNDVLLWDMKKAGLPRHLMGHDRWALRVAITPDGKTGISCTQYASQIIVWDLVHGKEKRRLTNFTGGIFALALAPDGHRLLSAGGDKLVRLWDINTGTQLRSYQGHAGPLRDIAFCADGLRFVSGGIDHEVLVWNVDQDQPLHRFKGHADQVNGVAYAADGRHVLSGSKDGTVRLWRVPTWAGGNAPFEQWLKDTQKLPAEKQVEEVKKKLMELNPRFDGKMTYKIEGTVVTELAFSTLDVSSIAPVKALTGLKKLSCIGTYKDGRGQLTDLSPLQGLPLVSLRFQYNHVADLAPLRGMLLTHLDCGYNNLSDLSVIQDMPLTDLRCGGGRFRDLAFLAGKRLTYFNCNNTSISDLAPLRGMPLTAVGFENCPVSDLSVLKGMDLTYLNCRGSRVADLSIAKDMPLRELDCEYKPERDAALLASIKTLEKINGQPKDDVLATMKEAPAAAREIDLLKLIDPAKHAVIGKWAFDGNVLVSPKEKPLASLQVPYTPPAEYEVEAVATRVEVGDSGYGLVVGLIAGNRQFHAIVDDYKGNGSGLAMIDGKTIADNETYYRGGVLKTGKASTIICRVQRGAVSVRCDSQVLVNWKGDFGRLSLHPLWKMPESNQLYLGATNASFRISKLVLRPLSQGVDDAWIKSVQAMPAEKQVEAVAAKLKELNPGFDGKVTHKIEAGVVTELKFFTDNVEAISPVRALAGLTKLECNGSGWAKGKLRDLGPLQGMKLKDLWTDFNLEVKTLAPLAGMPLESLNCCGNTLTDLTPLKGMPLKYLQFNANAVVDLTPLKDMPLNHLVFQENQVRDLSPLRGLPLVGLDCVKTPIQNFEPLTLSPLYSVRGDFKPERDAAILRSIKTLQKINRQPAAEFLKQLSDKKP